MNNPDSVASTVSETLPELGERLLADGAAALTNAELLAAILIHNETRETALQLAEKVIAASNGLHGLAQTNLAELQRISGLGRAALAQILAVLELSKRLIAGEDARTRRFSRPPTPLAASATCVFSVKRMCGCCCSISARCVIGIQTIYIGTINMSVLRIAEVFRDAMTRNSPAIILAHNHPSGDPSPSPEDIELTQSVANAGRLLDISLLDHIIMGHQGWVSLRDLGIAF